MPTTRPKTRLANLTTAVALVAMLAAVGCSDDARLEPTAAKDARERESDGRALDGSETGSANTAEAASQPSISEHDPDGPVLQEAAALRSGKDGKSSATAVLDDRTPVGRSGVTQRHEPGEAAAVRPPCADGSCEPRDISGIDPISNAVGGGSAAGGDTGAAATVEEVLEKGLGLAGVSPVHLAFRGRTENDSVRCEWRGVARTPEQREQAVRFWLDLDDEDELPSAAEVERLFMEELDRINPIFPETVKSNFRALARGGLSTDFQFLTCYVDYTVDEYLLGSSSATTTTLTIAYDRRGEGRSYDLYSRAHAAGEFGSEALMSEQEYEDHLGQIASAIELLLSVIF